MGLDRVWESWAGEFCVVARRAMGLPICIFNVPLQIQSDERYWPHFIIMFIYLSKHISDEVNYIY